MANVLNRKVVDAEGNTIWYKNDVYHREDGPAIEYWDGDREWWLNGEKLSEEEFKKRTAG
jgi:hypothetical protein